MKNNINFRDHIQSIDHPRPTKTLKMTSNADIPWVEKYRPTIFKDIVLDPTNRQIFDNILEKNYFPNLLFYGPPGTGKTTTIINLINAYQKRYNQVSRSTIIHLNASDERGIDIIRNQIYQFVRSDNMFDRGVKFVILDEVDYMTKNAQQALKYLLQSATNVRFCLICNYICKIDESLKHELMAIRFNQLPHKDIETFIKNVAKHENLTLSDSVIDTIQKLYHSDIRSMINFIQLHQNVEESIIITDEVYRNLWQKIAEPNQNVTEEGEDHDSAWEYIHHVSIQYNTDKRNILKNAFNYLIRRFPERITHELLDIAKTVIHIYDADIRDSIDHITLFYRGFAPLPGPGPGPDPSV
jgi:replication factor C subunit 3/5